MNFDSAFEELLGHEGKYANHPSDPGGETMWGVTKKVALAHGYTGPMMEMPLQTAKDIAKKEYWDKYHCDELPYELAFQLFDAAYNGGYPVQWLQKAVKVKVDGDLGPRTLEAVKAMDEDKIILRFDAYRLLYLSGLGTWGDFGRGWARRIANNLIAATEP